MRPDPLSLELEFVRKESSGDPYECRFIPQDYILRRGQGQYEEAHFPWSEELMHTLQEVRLRESDPDKVQRLGDTLRQFLATAGWGTSEALIQSAVERQGSVVLTLRSAAAELYTLPWELMTLERGGQHLGELPTVLIRYAWPEISAAPEDPGRGAGGRILFAWSQAGGRVPAPEHEQAITRACAAAAHPFVPEQDVLPNVSWGRLNRALERAKESGNPISVVHLLCHGTGAGSGFGLVFSGESSPGEAVILDAARMRQLLAPHAGMVRLVVLSACDGGNIGAFGNHLGSVAQEVHRARIAQVVASRHPLSIKGSIRLSEAFYKALLGGSADVAQAFLAARQRLVQDATDRDWAALQLYSASDPQAARPIVFCPYPGRTPFAPQHARFFCGRERESEEIADRFVRVTRDNRPRIVAVVGPSGSGKSSLLSASAIPKILSRFPAGTKVTTLCPGANPVREIELACDGFSADKEQILLIDQLEQLFTQGAEEDERRSVGPLLWRLATSDSTRKSILLCLRSDFLQRAAELPLDAQGTKLGAILSDRDHGYWLNPPEEPQLRDAVVTPAARVGLRLEPGLIERIIEELEAQPGALSLMQLTLEQLWQHREDGCLTQASFDRLGGVIGVLLAHADRVMDSLDPELAGLLPQLLVRFGSGFTTGSQPVRRRVSRAGLRQRDEARQQRWNQLLELLIRERILLARSSPDAREFPEGVVEVAHDALLQKWPRLLSWVDKARPLIALRENFDRWVAERKARQTLLTGSQLGYALQMAAEYPEALDEEGRELLTQSERNRAAEEELKLRGLDTLRLLAARSVFAADCTRITTALLETRSQEVTTIPGWLETAVDILHNQVLCTAEIEHGWGLCDARWSPDGESVVLAGLDGTAQVWEVGASTLRPIGAAHGSPTLRASYSPNGEKLLVLYVDGTARVLDASSGELLVELRGHQHAITAGAWSRDGRVVATASQDQSARLFDSQSGKQIAVLSGFNSAVMGVVLSPDGQRVYTACADGSIAAYSRDDKGRWSRALLVESGPSLTSLAISADGTQLATGSMDAGVRIHDLSDLSDLGSPTELWGHEQSVMMVAFSLDGDRLVSCSQDRTARLWSVRSEHPPCLLMGHRMAIGSASFSRDGRRIVTACADGRARLWDATRSGLQSPRRVKPRVLLPEGLLYKTKNLEPVGPSVTSEEGRYRAEVVGATEVVVTPPAERGAPFSIDAGPDALTGIRFSPRGDRLLLFAEHRILLCDLQERTLRWLSGHTYKITCVAISPDGQWLITGAEDWTARIWSLTRPGESRVLSGHEETPVLVLFDESSRRALTVEQGGATRIWPESGPPIVLLPGDRPDHVVAITRDWKKLVTQMGSDEDAQLYLWDLDLDPKTLQAKLGTASRLELSAEEYQMLYLRKPRPGVPE